MPGPLSMMKNCSPRTVPRVPSSSKVQQGHPVSVGGAALRAGDTKDRVPSFPFPPSLRWLIFFPSNLGLAVLARTFPGTVLIRKERLGGVQLDLALVGLWVLPL